MNLYKLHHKPKSLHGYEERNNVQQLKSIASDPDYALWYATDVLKGRFPEGEKAIASDSQHAYWYAKDIIKGRFPEGEPAIASDPYYNNLYQKLLNK